MDALSDILRGLAGLGVFLGVAVLFSADRKNIPWRVVGVGLLLQFVLAALVMHVPPVRIGVELVGLFFVKLLGFTADGTRFLFGSLLDEQSHGVIFALSVLPSIVFFSALSAALYYLGILQRIVHGMAWIFSKTMRLSGPETLSASANVFLGQTEAPLLIRPWLAHMTKSEILCIMIGGMATVAGAVMIAYISLLGGGDPAQQLVFATHLLTKSVITVPAALMIAKILLPQTEPVDTSLHLAQESNGVNLLDAICRGTTDGVKLAVNVGAMLLVFTALVALVNYVLEGWIGEVTGWNELVTAWSGGVFDGFSLDLLLGMIFAPVAWLMGISSDAVMVSGALLGERTMLNEFVSFVRLGELKATGAFADPRNLMILTYALAGFANIVSIGVQIGGIGGLAPSQRETLARFGWRALLGASLACFMTGAVAGIVG
ncbi:MAG: NupC/NupG family nucleoside CNT transporter [Chthoniobacterales bacterium]